MKKREDTVEAKSKKIDLKERFEEIERGQFSDKSLHETVEELERRGKHSASEFLETKTKELNDLLNEGKLSAKEYTFRMKCASKKAKALTIEQKKKTVEEERTPTLAEYALFLETLPENVFVLSRMLKSGKGVEKKYYFFLPLCPNPSSVRKINGKWKLIEDKPRLTSPKSIEWSETNRREKAPTAEERERHDEEVKVWRDTSKSRNLENIDHLWFMVRIRGFRWKRIKIDDWLKAKYCQHSFEPVCPLKRCNRREKIVLMPLHDLRGLKDHGISEATITRVINDPHYEGLATDEDIRSLVYPTEEKEKDVTKQKTKPMNPYS